MRSLQRIRRVTAVLSSALLFQLSMLASGTLCPMHGDHAANASPAERTTAHQHSVAGQTHHTSADASPLVGSAAQDTGAPASPCDMNGTSCDMPWSEGGCTSMTTCAIGTSAPSSADVVLGATSTTIIVVAAAATLPLGPTFAPELPPPRV